jgi:hypothetical protein
MRDDSILRVQDYLLQITNNSGGWLDFSFEELDEDGQDPLQIVTQYYGRELFGGNPDLLTLTEMLIDIDQESAGWVGTIGNIFKQCGVGAGGLSIVQILADNFGQNSKIWLITPQKAQDYIDTQDDADTEDDIDLDDHAGMAKDIPPVTNSWRAFLFLKDGHYFLLHLGYAGQAQA